MNDRVTIAVDAMGGDFGPAVTTDSAVRFLNGASDARVILVGDEDALRAHLDAAQHENRERIEVLHAPQAVGMDEAPVHALRNKKESSMWMAVDLVKSGRAQVCLSAGNTGALFAMSHYLLRTLPGIERPALITELPGLSNSVYMLDLGANVDCKIEHLTQFAVMGSVLVTALKGIADPRIGLLNIGSEEIKGNDLVKEVDRELRASTLNYIGYIEADRIYHGDCDVVVTDGFSGNISLKTAEGASAFIIHSVREAFQKNWRAKVAGLLAAPAMRFVKERIDSRRYNGATLLGLQGIVIKSHGNADSVAFTHALEVARAEALTNIPKMIDLKLEQMLAAE